MREKLKTYIDFLFAGAPKTAATEETKAEILQNTLDKYDDFIAQGKSPEAAYSLAVSGIGDPREFLGEASVTPMARPASPSTQPQLPEKYRWISGVLLGVAVMMYILCVVPVIATGSPVGMFVMIAVATCLLILRSYLPGKSCSNEEKEDAPEEKKRDSGLCASINGLIRALALVCYLILSFTTMAWHITWVIFPISAAVQGVVRACFELMEGEKE